MLIGVPKEIKTHEYRVGLVPASVRELIHNGHQVLVETNAGSGIGFDDQAYVAAGAGIAKNAAEVFAKAEMIVKVKEPQAVECKMLRKGQLLFTYLHLAPDPDQTKGLMESGCTAIAYETVTSARGGLPLLAPMITTRAGATPGTPPRRMPAPPCAFSRQCAPTWMDMRPATSLMGASSGRPPRGFVTVS